MRELKTSFLGKGQVKGFMFTQVEKSNFGYIYEVFTGNSYHYEVFKRIENNHFNCISYPSNKSFGKWAWTFWTLEKSKCKFNELELLFEIKPNYNG